MTKNPSNAQRYKMTSKSPKPLQISLSKVAFKKFSPQSITIIFHKAAVLLTLRQSPQGLMQKKVKVAQLCLTL